jgi:Abnormal spindle-like microcephaly-assoc'd, ASPM-SPD-2-Hydin
VRDLGARTKVVLILLAVLTMLGCQALNASKPAQVSQASQSSQTTTSQDTVLTPSMAVLDFGTVAVGGTEVLSNTVVNKGDSPIRIKKAVLHGPEFKIAGEKLPTTLAPGESTSLEIAYSPRTHESSQDTVTLTTDTSSLSTSFSVRGQSTSPGQLTVNPSSVTFGMVAVGSSLSKTATLSNVGGSNLVVNQVSASDSSFTVSGISVPLIMVPGQTVPVAVTFTPTSSGTDSGSVSIIATVSTSSGHKGGKGGHGLTASASTSTAATVAVSGTGVMTGQLTAAPASIDFGKVQINSSPQVVAGTLTNSGGTSVNINSAAITGAGFTLSGLSSSLALAPGGSVSFSVSFAPQTSGAVSGNIAVSSDAANSSLNVPLAGTGVTPGSVVSSPSSLGFGTVQVNTSKTLSATVTNSGGTSVTISQATATGTGYSLGNFSVPMSLSAGQSKTFSVTFAPQSSGSASGSVSIISDASDPTMNVPLSGTGATPGTLGANPGSLSFGNVQVGSSQTLQETVSNSGGSSVTITQANVPSGFTVTGLTLPATVGAGQSTSFSVKFSPQAGGPASGSLSIISDASNPTLGVSLSGAGTTPGSLAASPASLSFGNVQVGNSQTLQETVTNSGGLSVTITQANVPSGFTVTGLTLPATVGAGQSTSFSVKFSPQSGGPASGNLSIISDASNSTLSVPLSGSGTTPGSLAPSPASLSFGSVQVGDTKSLQETLTNSGGSTVSVTQANSTNAAFVVSGLTLPLTLGAGQSASFNVSFNPQSGGPASGKISVLSDASNSTLDISLSGSGTTPGVLAVASSSLSFGSVAINSTGSKTESLTNSGGTAVKVSQANVTGTGFSITGLALPLTLNPGQSFTFGVNFAPKSAGSISGSIDFVSDASNPSLSVSLSGTGASVGQLTVSPATLSFGSVIVGQSKTMSATLSATGANVTVSSAGFNTSEFTLSGVSFPLTVTAGQSATISVVFTPQASGTASDSVSFASNASNSPAVAALSGSGTPPPQHNVNLLWSASSSSVVGYNVYRGSKSGGPYSKINSVLDASTSYTDSSVQAGTTYFYVSTAVDGNGMESGFSNQVQAAIPTP